MCTYIYIYIYAYVYDVMCAHVSPGLMSTAVALTLKAPGKQLFGSSDNINICLYIYIYIYTHIHKLCLL